MTNEQALAMLSDAEGYIWAFVPPTHFISEHPVEQAVIQDLQDAQRSLKREIRNAQALVFCGYEPNLF